MQKGMYSFRQLYQHTLLSHVIVWLLLSATSMIMNLDIVKNKCQKSGLQTFVV